MSKILGAIITAGAMVLAAPAFAHAILKSSVPMQGTTVSAPKELNMTFTSKVTLTAVKLTSGGQDVPLKTERAAPASESHAIALPLLKTGAYDVRWTAFASDGHAMTGKWAFTVGADTPVAPAGHAQK